MFIRLPYFSVYEAHRPKEGSPDVSLPNYLVQLIGVDAEVFPGQLRGIVSPACPGSSRGFLTCPLYEAKRSAYFYLPCYFSESLLSVLSFLHLRMNYPMQTTKAPSRELLTPNPPAPYPVNLQLLKLMHTVTALFPTHHCLLMMAWVQRRMNLPLPHPCLLLLMPPWRLMTHPHRTREFQMDSGRTWIETGTNQSAVNLSYQFTMYSSLSSDTAMVSATVVLVL